MLYFTIFTDYTYLDLTYSRGSIIMKKLLSLVLILLLVIHVVPNKILAAPTELELQQYLLESGLTAEQLDEYLDFNGLVVEDFETIEELRDFLGDVLTEENIHQLLDEYELTLEELESLLVEYGDIEEGQSVFDAFLFYNDVYYAASYYLDNTFTPIDETNLQELLDKYELTYDDLLALLEENDDSMDYYEYIEDLDSMVDYYLYYSEDMLDIDALFTEIGLSDEELDNLFNHFLTLDLENPDFTARLLDIAERMEAIGEFDSADDLTAEQIADIMSMFTEALNILEVDIKYYLVKGDDKKPISFETLMTIETTDGYDLLLEMYNNEGTFLADILLTNEMFGSEIIEEVGNDLKEVEKVVSQAPAPKKVVKQTVKGGKLPNTASDYPTNTLLAF